MFFEPNLDCLVVWFLGLFLGEGSRRIFRCLFPRVITPVSAEVGGILADSGKKVDDLDSQKVGD